MRHITDICLAMRILWYGSIGQRRKALDGNSNRTTAVAPRPGNFALLDFGTKTTSTALEEPSRVRHIVNDRCHPHVRAAQRRQVRQRPLAYVSGAMTLD